MDIVWDIRGWHGGTPNLSAEVRAIPGVGFAAPWLSPTVMGFLEPGLLPRSVWRTTPLCPCSCGLYSCSSTVVLHSVLAVLLV